MVSNNNLKPIPNSFLDKVATYQKENNTSDIPTAEELGVKTESPAPVNTPTMYVTTQEAAKKFNEFTSSNNTTNKSSNSGTSKQSVTPVNTIQIVGNSPAPDTVYVTPQQAAQKFNDFTGINTNPTPSTPVNSTPKSTSSNFSPQVTTVTGNLEVIGNSPKPDVVYVTPQQASEALNQQNKEPQTGYVQLQKTSNGSYSKGQLGAKGTYTILEENVGGNKDIVKVSVQGNNTNYDNLLNEKQVEFINTINKNEVVSKSQNAAEQTKFLQSKEEGTKYAEGYINFGGSKKEFDILGDTNSYLIQKPDNQVIQNLGNANVIKLTVTSDNPKFDEISKLLGETSGIFSKATENEYIKAHEIVGNPEWTFGSGRAEAVKRQQEFKDSNYVLLPSGFTSKSDIDEILQVKDSEGNVVYNPTAGIDEYYLKDSVERAGEFLFTPEEERKKDKSYYDKIEQDVRNSAFTALDTVLWTTGVGGLAAKGVLGVTKTAAQIAADQSLKGIAKESAKLTTSYIIKNPVKSGLTALNVGSTGYTLVDESMTGEEKLLTSAGALAGGAFFGGLTKGVTRLNSYNNIGGKISKFISKPKVDVEKVAGKVYHNIENKANDLAFKTVGKAETKVFGSNEGTKTVKQLYDEYAVLKKEKRELESDLSKILGAEKADKVYAQDSTKIINTLYYDYDKFQKQGKVSESALYKMVGGKKAEEIYNTIGTYKAVSGKVGKISAGTADGILSTVTSPLGLTMTGLGVGYGIDVYGRISTSDNPFGTAVNIYSTEILPMAYGGKKAYTTLGKFFTNRENTADIKKTLRNINKEKSSGIAEAAGLKDRSLYEIEQNKEFYRGEASTNKKLLQEDVRDYLIKENIEPEELAKLEELERLSNGERGLSYNDIINNTEDIKTLDKIKKLMDESSNGKTEEIKEKSAKELVKLMNELESGIVKKSKVELRDYKNKLIKDLREVKGINVLDSETLGLFSGDKLKTNRKTVDAYLKARTAKEGYGAFIETKDNGLSIIPLFEAENIRPEFLTEGFRKGISVFDPYNISNINRVNAPNRVLDNARKELSELGYKYAGTHATDSGRFLDNKYFNVTEGTSEIHGMYFEGAPFVGRYWHMRGDEPDLRLSLFSKYSTDMAERGLIVGMRDLSVAPRAKETQNDPSKFKKIYGKYSKKHGTEQNIKANREILESVENKRPSERTILPQMKREAEGVVPVGSQIKMFDSPATFLQVGNKKVLVKTGLIADEITVKKTIPQRVKEALISEIKNTSASLKSLKAKSSELADKILEKIPDLTEGQYRNLHSEVKNYIENIKDIRVTKSKSASPNSKSEVKYEIITKDKPTKSQKQTKSSSSYDYYGNTNSENLPVVGLMTGVQLSNTLQSLPTGESSPVTINTYAKSGSNSGSKQPQMLSSPELLSTSDFVSESSYNKKSAAPSSGYLTLSPEYIDESPLYPKTTEYPKQKTLPSYDTKPYREQYNDKPYNSEYPTRPYNPEYPIRPYQPAYPNKPYQPSYPNRPYQPPYSPTPSYPPYYPPNYPTKKTPPYEEPKKKRKDDDSDDKKKLRRSKQMEQFAIMTHTVRNPLSLLGDNSYIDVEQYNRAKGRRVKTNGRLIEDFQAMPQNMGGMFGIPIKSTTKSKPKTKTTKGKAKPSKKAKNSKKR